MITLENDVLEFRFPEVHEKARCSIEFQRTLRIPDDDRDYPMKRERYELLVSERDTGTVEGDVYYSPLSVQGPGDSMGLAPGGRMKQDIYDDLYGLDAWDQRHASRCFVTIVNSMQWMAVTGEQPPARPPTARTYTEAGLPWFDYYGGDIAAVDGAGKLRAIDSVAKIAEEKGTGPLPDNETIDVTNPVKLGKHAVRQVREGAIAGF